MAGNWAAYWKSGGAKDPDVLTTKMIVEFDNAKAGQMDDGSWDRLPLEVRQAIAQARANVTMYMRGMAAGYQAALGMTQECSLDEVGRISKSLRLYPPVFRRALIENLEASLPKEPEKACEEPVAEEQEEPRPAKSGK